jgi:hypothetical protein
MNYISHRFVDLGGGVAGAEKTTREVIGRGNCPGAAGIVITTPSCGLSFSSSRTMRSVLLRPERKNLKNRS